MQRGIAPVYSKQLKIVYVRSNMADYLLQYNPSTLKVSYNSSTNKAQMFDVEAHFTGDDCEDCLEGTTPTFVDVFFSGVNGCSGCYLRGPFYHKYIGVPQPSGSYRLTQETLGGIEFCVWSVRITGDFGTVQEWTEGTCSVFKRQDFDLSEMIIRCEKTGVNTAEVVVELGPPGPGFSSSWGITSTSDCVVGTSSSSPSCTSTSTYSGGSVVITEVWP